MGCSIDAALAALASLLGTGDPPASHVPDAPPDAPGWPQWAGLTADAAHTASDELDGWRQHVYSQQVAAASIIAGAGDTTRNARLRMDDVRAAWEQDKSALAPVASTTAGQAALLAAGQRRLGEASGVVRDAMAKFGAAAQRLQTVSAEFPVTAPPRSPIQLVDRSWKKDPTPAATRPHDDRPDIEEALSRPLPEDPKKFHELWSQLTKEEKDWLYSQDPSVGNHPGMDWDPADHLGKDHYNQLHLSQLEQQNQSDVDRLQQRVNELVRQQYMGDHSATTANELAQLTPQLLAARHSLQGYQTVRAVLDRNDGVKRYLGVIDGSGHAAIAIGDPDQATRNAIFVPGTGQDLATFAGSDAKSLAMYNAAHNADPRQVLAVTTWMGYDRPMDLSQAAWPDPARAGAGNLDAFESGLRASHVGAPSLDTVIGHSYGSTLVGAAASGEHHLDANNVIAVGSPGLLVHHAGDLNLAPGSTVYAMRARNDIIELVTGLTLGPDPMASDFGATRLWAAPGPSSDPLGLTPSVEAHSSYWSPGNPALDNLGAVIAGLPPPPVLGPDGSR